MDEDLHSFLSATGIATVFLGPDLAIRSYSPDVLRWFRFQPHDIGRPFTDIGSQLDVRPLHRMVCDATRSSSIHEVDLATDTGNELVRVRIAPYRDGLVLTMSDLSHVARYARETGQALAEARARANEIEQIYRYSPGAMGLLDSDLRYLRANPKLGEIDGLPPEDHIGKHLLEVHPALGPEMASRIRAIIDGGDNGIRATLRGRSAADGDRIHYWQADFFRIKREDGGIAVGFKLYDVTQLIELQADLRRMMRELQHRVKNMLSNVIALVNRAKRDRRDHDVALDTLSSRIRAMATTHNLLTAENWISSNLRDIVEMELTQVYGAERLDLRGPETRLNARATLGIGMALHELATNAAKYGAFSDPAGRVSLRWSRMDEGDGEMLILNWTETNGPSVTAPDRRGFGTQLIHSMVEGTLSGTVSESWEPEGLRVVISLPWTTATEIDYDSDIDPLRDADPLP